MKSTQKRYELGPVLAVRDVVEVERRGQDALVAGLRQVRPNKRVILPTSVTCAIVFCHVDDCHTSTTVLGSSGTPFWNTSCQPARGQRTQKCMHTRTDVRGALVLQNREPV